MNERDRAATSRTGGRVDRVTAAVSGLVAGMVALAAGELVASLTGATSLVVAVGNVVVDRTPGPVVKWAIDLLGTADKPVLLGTVVVAVLAIAAMLGPIAARWPSVALLSFVVFGLVGFAAAAADPFNGTGIAALLAIAAAVAGWAALRVLLAAAPRIDEEPRAVMPGAGVADRRRFLAFAGAAAGGSAAAVFTGQVLSGRGVDVEAQREAVLLPGETLSATAMTPVAPEDLQIEDLSPLITPNDRFYRIDTAFVVPRVDVTTWRLKVHGMVDRPFELSFDELLAMAELEESATLACVSNEVGGRLVGNAIWRGVPLAHILERAGVQEGATQIVGRSVDDFTVGFPTEVALDGRAAMVAIAMNGEPLPLEHGFPARLVIPGLYGYVSATKWLGEIELTRLEDFDGYWIPRGWAKEAPIKTQSRIDVPRTTTLTPGLRPVAGVAWGGIRGISKVEVRIAPVDGDPTDEWLTARLSDELTSSSWRQWVVEWDAQPGEYWITVRATDGEGVTQTEEEARPDPDGATGWHARRVTVRST